MSQIVNSIIKWNEDRDNNTYDPALEFAMLNEELLEYVHSYIRTVNDHMGYDIHTIDEETYESNKEKMAEYVNSTEFHLDWQVNQLDALCDIVFVAIGSMGKLLKQDLRLVVAALWSVIEANEQKSTDKDENGKITKPDDFVGPEKELRALIEVVNND